MITGAARALIRAGVACAGRCRLSTGHISLSRNAIRRMLLQEDASQWKKSHMNFGLPRVGEAAVEMERGTKKVKAPKNSARLRNLSKVYLDKITDILSTGEVATQLYGRGLELSQVSIHPNRQGIIVYWVTTGTPEQDLETEQILQSHVRTIRQELSNLRILGHAPPITFIRDEQLLKLQEVDRLLAIADYGADFEPTCIAHQLKAGPPTLAMPLDTRIKTAIKGLQGEDGQEGKEDPPDPFEEALRIAASEPPPGEDVSDAVNACTLPAMRGDVMGVNTSKIYSLIQQSIKNARAEHRKEDKGDSLSSSLDHHPESTSPLSTSKKQDIQKWARQYKQMQRKEARKKNKEAALLSYPGDLLAQDWEEQPIEVKSVEDEDYIEEFE